jgi:hypothetical protein
LVDEIAVLHEFADKRIDLVQRERELRTALEIAANKAILVHSQLQGSRTGIIDHRRAEPLG